MGDLIRYRLFLTIRCNACARISFAHAGLLADEAGYDLRMSELGRRSRCTACGHRGGTAIVHDRNPLG